MTLSYFVTFLDVRMISRFRLLVVCGNEGDSPALVVIDRVLHVSDPSPPFIRAVSCSIDVNIEREKSETSRPSLKSIRFLHASAYLDFLHFFSQFISLVVFHCHFPLSFFLHGSRYTYIYICVYLWRRYRQAVCSRQLI